MFGARRAAENYTKTEKMAHLLGVDNERLRLEWISAAESTKFAHVISDMVSQVKILGPSALKNGRQKKKD